MNRVQRIILIDDNEMDNIYHEVIVRNAGFAGEIVILEDGFKALAYLETADLDVPTYIFLDINRPRMDGFEVARRAAPLLAESRAVILIMLTSSASPADRERAGEMTVIQEFVTKPLTVELVGELMAKSF